ncbi:MAG TPA: hypothetical protein VJ951_13890 [Bacteroidales bacterium]|nr:hypothetical protein [Bacteroidales bacterium]
MFIQEQAEHFYNSYLVLKENSESLIKCLSNSSRKMEGTSNFGRHPTMGVEVVCLSFSVELYIKCLHYIISRELPRSHNILDLYKKFPIQIQEELFSYPAVKKYGWDSNEFEQMISTISDSFVKWRYSHEFKSLKYNTYFALVFVEALRKSINSRGHR